MNLIEKIKVNCKLKIKNELYKVLSKSKYTTKESQNELYWKFKLEKNKILVVIPNDEIIYFGNEIEKTNSIDLMTNKFTYNNELYEKIACGNQIYLNTEFGTPLETNCVFTDFENEKQTKVLSLAILGNNRSDIFAEYLQEQEIEVIYPTVLITGASRGIGSATAKIFASHNYNIIVNYNQNRELAEQLCKGLENEYHIKAIPLKADISNQKEIDSMLEEIKKKNIQIDCLVNNAGIDRDSLFEDKTFEDFEITLKTNLIGPFWLSKKIGLEMKKRKSGKIINVASTNAFDTYYPMSIDYDASKAGLVSLTHNLAVALAPYVNVNAVAPGWTKTDMVRELDEEYIEEENQKILLRRFGESEEIANVIYFLSTEEAKYINNEVIRVDGGWYL